jgi:hypothetical protein
MTTYDEKERLSRRNGFSEFRGFGRRVDAHYAGKEVGQAFQPGKPDLRAFLSSDRSTSAAR